MYTRRLTTGLLLALTFSLSGMDRPGQEGVAVDSCFVDLDGNCYCDTAADADGNGIPDALEFDRKAGAKRIRWAHFRSVPDSLGGDSLAFRRWWEAGSRPFGAAEAWRSWGEWTGAGESSESCSCTCGCPRCRCRHCRRQP